MLSIKFISEINRVKNRSIVMLLVALGLFIGTPSVIRPELTSCWAEHNLPYADVTV